MTGATQRSHAAFTLLAIVAALSLSILVVGVYRQNQDVEAIQNDQATQTAYLCGRLASLARRIATRTEPIQELLRIEAAEALQRGDAGTAARLDRLAGQVLVPQSVKCSTNGGGP